MTLAELKLLIDTNLPDNSTGLITPAKERQVMKAIADFVISSQGEADTGTFVFDPGFTYDAGDPVIYNNAWYLSLADSNLNNIPDSSPLSWDPINAFNTVLSIWEVNAVYLGNLTIVINDDKLYLLDRDIVGDVPYLSTDFAAELAAGDWINLLPNTTPVANTYANDTAMIAAQGSQVSGYFYFAGANLYVYLGTTVGDITDYFSVGGGGGGGIASVVGGTGIDVDITDPVNPVANLDAATIASLGNADTAFGWGDHASAGYNVGYQEATTRESNTVLFDKDYIIGNAAARTGNILFDFTGAKLGAWIEMKHQDASAFTFPTEAVLMFNVADISTTVDNYFLFVMTDKTASAEVVKVFHALEGGI